MAAWKKILNSGGVVGADLASSPSLNNSLTTNGSGVLSWTGMLPLSGGTLTGALTGTSAMFTGDVTIGDGSVKKSLLIDGLGSGWTGADIIFQTGHANRGGGMFIYNTDTDHEWYWGTPYVTSNEMHLCYESTSSFTQQTADTAHSLFKITTSGNATFGGNLSVGGDLAVTGSMSLGATTFTGVVDVAEYIKHTGDLTTNIRFQAGRTTFLGGGVEFLDYNNTTQDYVTLGGGTDIDTRVHGGAGYMFIQGSDGYIGINDTTPEYPFEVNAITHFTSRVTVSDRTIFYDSDNTSAEVGQVEFLRGTGGGASGFIKTVGDTSNGVANMQFWVSGKALTIDSSKNATFVGNVGINGGGTVHPLEVSGGHLQIDNNKSFTWSAFGKYIPEFVSLFLNKTGAEAEPPLLN